MHDININQLKLEVHDTYEKDEKITTSFEPSDNEDVINKAYLDEKLSKLDGHLSFLKKDNNEVKKLTKKHSSKEVLIRIAVKTTTQMLHDKGFLDIFPNADRVLKGFFCYKTQS